MPSTSENIPSTNIHVLVFHVLLWQQDLAWGTQMEKFKNNRKRSLTMSYNLDRHLKQIFYPSDCYGCKVHLLLILSWGNLTSWDLFMRIVPCWKCIGSKTILGIDEFIFPYRREGSYPLFLHATTSLLLLPSMLSPLKTLLSLFIA